MTPDPDAPNETERAGDLCAACGHERGEHLPPCEMGISTGRPCGCRQFKVPDETERAWLIARAWAHLDYREVIAIRSIAPDLAQIMEGLCSMYAIRIGGEGRTTYTRIRGATKRPLSRRDAADQLSREGQDMRLDEEPKPEVDWQAAYESVVGKAARASYLEAQLAETRTAMDAFHRSAASMRRDRDRLSEGLRKMARRSVEWRAEATYWASGDWQVENRKLRSELAELKAGRAAHVCDLGPALDAIRPGPGLRVEFADEAVPATFCAHHGDDNYFDRTLCAPPCDTMHTRCRKCHTPLEPCAHSTPADRGPLTPHPPPWPVDEP